MILQPLLIGLAAGLFGGLVGLGGGVIMVPLLTGWGRLPQHEAHGTSLSAIVFTGLVGSWVYATGNAVDWRAAFMISIGSVAAAQVAADYAGRISATALRRAFGVFLLFAAVLLPLKSHLPSLPSLTPAGALPVLLATGIVVGSLSGLLGIGGGVLLVPVLALVIGLPQHTAQGTSLAAMVPAAISGTLVHYRAGRVRYQIVPALLVGVIIGSSLGGHTALGLAAPTLRVIFSIVLVIMALRYMMSRRQKAGKERPGDEVPREEMTGAKRSGEESGNGPGAADVGAVE